MKLGNAIAVAAMTAACLVLSQPAVAHCDSLDGPVVRDARAALEKRDPTPVLKWVTAENESEIRDAFAKTLAVRNLGNDARLLADRYFFETLVRVHRAGEGEPFTGLKPAGRIDAGISAADASLEAGSAERLAKQLAQAIETDISKRFDVALERKKHSGESVAAGRAYVAAYVEYVHFVEGVHGLAEKGASLKHHDGE